MTLEDLALIFVRGVGSRGAAYLVDHFGSAEEVYAASRAALVDDAKLRPELAERIIAGEGMREAKAEVEYCRKHDIRIIAATDMEYPAPLREASDRPHVLFVRGNVEALSLRTLSMVGTREVSPSGIHVVDKLIGDLAEAIDDLCVVSGLAYGVDGACHRAALAHGATTIAVVASVLPEVTPTPHHALAEDIVRNGGAIVSELHSRTKQNGNLFLARNRIIAGMSAGVVVIESPATGGALSTAEMADSYGRIVMAVPGRITDGMSFGTNNLIRSGKARLILSARDIIDDLGWQITAKEVQPTTECDDDDLTANERLILRAFDSAATLDHAAMLAITGLSIGELAMEMMELELKGRIRALPGKRYEKV
ncbi:MAG: DNA-processing protein DprA [Alistipes sp.]|nr:DNA-processing protein DprA [Alistipes sp.]